MIKLSLQPILITEVHADPLLGVVGAAWQHSRPEFTGDAAAAALLIDAPVNDLAGMVLQMRVPVLFRDIIAGMRDHIMWARTSRVDNLLEVWPIHSSVQGADLATISLLASYMYDQATSDVPQDNYRLALPVSYMTNFTCRLSIRSAVKLLNYMRRLGASSGELQEACGEFIQQLSAILYMHRVPVAQLRNAYKEVDYTPALNLNEAMVTGAYGDTIVYRGYVPLALRAQIIRHRSFNIADTFKQLMLRADIWTMAISNEILMEVSAGVHVWREIIAERNCWMAQTDLWAPVLGEVNKFMPGQTLTLPCADGICPYTGDCQQRIEGRDPGVPCPRHLNLAANQARTAAFKIASIDSYKVDMLGYVEQSGRPREFWHNEIHNLTSVEP